MPNKVESVLQLKNYFVKHISFELNDEFDFSQDSEIQMRPQFERKISKIDDDNVKVSLCVHVDNTDGELVPFFVSIEVEGEFCLRAWEKENNIFIIENNAVAILFPYLRALLTTVTSNANMPPYILPIMNIIELFKQDKIDNKK